jgi:copper chaperone CopZ
MLRNAIAALALSLMSAGAMAETIEMTVTGLVCAFCAQGIEKTLRKNPSVADVVVSLEDKLVAVEVVPGTNIPDQDLRSTLTDAGYDIKVINRTQTSVAKIRTRLKRPTA